MFACAIWDSRQRSLLLARDRFGKKPLYYAALPQGLYFGSELKCLRAAGVPLEHDREALQLYFLLGYIPDPWTPYLAIRKLPPGGWLRCDADLRMEQGRYWTLPAPAERPPAGSQRTGSLRLCAQRIRPGRQNAADFRCSRGGFFERRNRFHFRSGVHGAAKPRTRQNIFHRI